LKGNFDMTGFDASECISACERLAIGSYSLMDHGSYAECAALFATHGVWVRGGKPFTGPASILSALEQRPQSQLSRHIVTNVVVKPVNENTAEATALFVPLRGAQEEAGLAKLEPPMMVGDLLFEFVREAGEWRIAKLTPRPVFKV
jgi:hypothetical protein